MPLNALVWGDIIKTRVLLQTSVSGRNYLENRGIHK